MYFWHTYMYYHYFHLYYTWTSASNAICLRRRKSCFFTQLRCLWEPQPTTLTAMNSNDPNPAGPRTASRTCALPVLPLDKLTRTSIWFHSKRLVHHVAARTALCNSSHHCTCTLTIYVADRWLIQWEQCQVHVCIIRGLKYHMIPLLWCSLQWSAPFWLRKLCTYDIMELYPTTSIAINLMERNYSLWDPDSGPSLPSKTFILLLLPLGKLKGYIGAWAEVN